MLGVTNNRQGGYFVERSILAWANMQMVNSK
jgi:hypothetical protein